MIPIFGMSELELTKSSNWEFTTTTASPFIANWQGDNPPEIPLSWTLVAGTGEVATREMLFDYVKMWHAMTAASYLFGNSVVLPPPKVSLVIGGLIKCSGIVKTATARVKRPWGGDGELLPTVAEFQGTFVPLPGYDGTTTNIASLSEAFNGESIRQRFYSE